MRGRVLAFLLLQGATLLRDCTVLIRGQRSLCIIRCLCWTAEYSAFLGRVSSHYANIYGSAFAGRDRARSPL